MVLSNSFEVGDFEGTDTAAPAEKKIKRIKIIVIKTVALLKAAPWLLQFVIQLM